MPVFYRCFNGLKAESVVKLSEKFHCVEKFWKFEFFVLMNEDEKTLFLFPHYVAVCHDSKNMTNWETVFFNQNPVSYMNDMDKLKDHVAIFVKSAFEELNPEDWEKGSKS